MATKKKAPAKKPAARKTAPAKVSKAKGFYAYKLVGGRLTYAGKVSAAAKPRRVRG